MSQQLLQCCGSLRNSAACLMHPLLLELTPQCTHAQVRTHTLPGTWGLVFPAPVTFNEEERGIKGHGGGGGSLVCEILRFPLSRRIGN